MIIQISNARAKHIMKTLLQSSLNAVNANKIMKHAISKKSHYLCVNDVEYHLSQYQRVMCVGAGKASGHMAKTVEQILGTHLDGGLVIVKDGYGTPTRKIQILEASHPLPDTRGVRATQKILNRVTALSKHDLLIVLLSGGASSLLCAPAPGLTLADKHRTTDRLLRCGAGIQDVNSVRKHLSAIKGGQLATRTKASILTIIVSDVIGDDVTTIGSGPTVPDPTTFQETQAILKHYRILSKIPRNVRTHLNRGIKGDVPETWKRRVGHSPRHRSFILANNHTALEAMAKEAKGLGLNPHILEYPFQGEARELGAILGTIAKDIRDFGNPVRPPACLIAGGEPTVTVTGKGKGGRAQECVLAAAQEVAGLSNVVVAGFGTDGTDGPTDVAGAIADGKTVSRANRKGVDLQKSLNAHNSYGFFKIVGGHIITGPTSTNVNDIYLAIVL